jgi:hypothetical protein
MIRRKSKAMFSLRVDIAQTFNKNVEKQGGTPYLKTPSTYTLQKKSYISCLMK